MARHQLSEGARAEIERKIDQLFDRLLARFVGSSGGPKIIGFEVVSDPILSLPGMFLSSAAEGGVPDSSSDTVKSLARIASNYINGVREQAKAKIIHAVDNAIVRTEAEEEENVMKQLEGQLSGMLTDTASKVRRVLETETANARNEGLFDGIVRMSTNVGIGDPVVYKVVVKDEVLCKTCKKLWLMPDLTTPRLYYLSEMRHEYMNDHKHPYPTVGNSHPHCRCTMTFLMPGFGFDESGSVKWVEEGHLEIKKQRGQAQ